MWPFFSNAQKIEDTNESESINKFGIEKCQESSSTWTNDLTRDEIQKEDFLPETYEISLQLYNKEKRRHKLLLVSLCILVVCCFVLVLAFVHKCIQHHAQEKKKQIRLERIIQKKKRLDQTKRRRKELLQIQNTPNSRHSQFEFVEKQRQQLDHLNSNLSELENPDFQFEIRMFQKKKKKQRKKKCFHIIESIQNKLFNIDYEWCLEGCDLCKREKLKNDPKTKNFAKNSNCNLQTKDEGITSKKPLTHLTDTLKNLFHFGKNRRNSVTKTENPQNETLQRVSPTIISEGKDVGISDGSSKNFKSFESQTRQDIISDILPLCHLKKEKDTIQSLLLSDKFQSLQKLKSFDFQGLLQLHLPHPNVCILDEKLARSLHDDYLLLLELLNQAENPNLLRDLKNKQLAEKTFWQYISNPKSSCSLFRKLALVKWAKKEIKKFGLS